ncbi:flagellar biosynthesis anti-sigma factor FlgM [Sphingomonas hengshuiensis]|uniref:Negative regulator of flagellin synthesis n=1 Tax=Sphingomonas hengshuiensis TaxID=1609977 RepID=A0A7U4JB10_9SPHN|nr:flagellar biosynthesis anti-sigma factor FlgM [Sphingomonas hengshuiensis]AJP73518.1 hypothetical protein TS85_19570 [Sphingomonas hengshuiensis]
MVDPIGNKAGAVSDRRIAPIGRAAPVEAAKPVASEAPAVQSTAAQLSAELAAKPPVDAERVARLRAAIQEGRYSRDPGAVADRMLALKNEWNSDDPA